VNSELPDNLSWVVHPASTHPIRTALSVMFISMIAGALYQLTDGFLYSTIAVIVLLVSLSPFFLPTTYSLTDKGVSLRRMGILRSLKWVDVRSKTVTQGAIFVSPHPAESIRQSGGILIFCPGNYSEVLKYLEKLAIV